MKRSTILLLLSFFIAPVYAVYLALRSTEAIAVPAKPTLHLKTDCELSRDLILAANPLWECEQGPEGNACRQASDWFLWHSGKPDPSWPKLLEKASVYFRDVLHIENYAAATLQASQRLALVK